MNEVIRLSALDLSIAALMLIASAGLSLWLSLGLQRQLLVAATRMVLQLLLVGLLLHSVFQVSSAWATGALVLAMLLAAGREVSARQERRLRGAWHFAPGALSVIATTLGISVLALTTALRPHPWYDARHAIPLVGIVLGTAMNSASLTLHYVFATATRERTAIEARLLLGETRYCAFGGVTRHAVRAGVLPVMNQMAAAGIITLPGIMTGQVFAGMDPVEAAKYQILLMFFLASAGVVASTLAAYLAIWRLTDERERLRLDRLQAAA